MAGKDIIEMRVKDLKRLKIIHKAIEKHIPQKTAALLIGITERQIWEEGDKDIIHKSRGKASKQTTPEKIKEHDTEAL